MPRNNLSLSLHINAATKLTLQKPPQTQVVATGSEQNPVVGLVNARGTSYYASPKYINGEWMFSFHTIH